MGYHRDIPSLFEEEKGFSWLFIIYLATLQPRNIPPQSSLHLWESRCSKWEKALPACGHSCRATRLKQARSLIEMRIDGILLESVCAKK